jgi:hypothetical protein
MSEQVPLNAYVDGTNRYLSIGFNFDAFSLYSLQKLSGLVADKVMIPVCRQQFHLPRDGADRPGPHLDHLDRFHERR